MIEFIVNSVVVVGTTARVLTVTHAVSGSGIAAVGCVTDASASGESL